MFRWEMGSTPMNGPTLKESTQKQQTMDELKAAHPALFVLFGGIHCGVCQVIKPKLETLLAENFPDIAFVYLDCEQHPDICGQSRVFSLPTIQFFLEGQLSLEKSRVFSLKELAQDIDRLYRLWHQ